MIIRNISIFAYKVRRRLLGYLFWVLFRLKCFISKKEMVTFKLVDGSDFDYPLRSYIGEALFSKDFENNEIAFLRRSLKPGHIVLDVGANGGIFTVISAKQVGPQGHVYAFEPGERELVLLKHNIKLNNLTNVTIVESAVSDKSGSSKFAVVKDGALNSLADLDRPEQKIESWRTVTTISLDDFMSKFSVPIVDFIKIDVEGAEKLVFDGAKKVMASDNKITILFEASDYNNAAFGYSTNQLLSELSQMGLEVFYLDILTKLQMVNIDNAKLGNKIYNFVTFNR